MSRDVAGGEVANEELVRSCACDFECIGAALAAPSRFVRCRGSSSSTGDAVVRNQLLYKISSDLRTKVIAVRFDYHWPILYLGRYPICPAKPTLTLIPGLNALLR